MSVLGVCACVCVCVCVFPSVCSELTQIIADVVADPTLPRTTDHECPKYVFYKVSGILRCLLF